MNAICNCWNRASVGLGGRAARGGARGVEASTLDDDNNLGDHSMDTSAVLSPIAGIGRLVRLFGVGLQILGTAAKAVAG